MKKDKGGNNKYANICFEEALDRLESIVKELEKGDLPLQESLDKFAEGVEMTQICLTRLNVAEQQIDKIVQNMQGNYVEKPLILQEEEKC